MKGHTKISLNFILSCMHMFSHVLITPYHSLLRSHPYKPYHAWSYNYTTAMKLYTYIWLHVCLMYSIIIWYTTIYLNFLYAIIYSENDWHLHHDTAKIEQVLPYKSGYESGSIFFKWESFANLQYSRLHNGWDQLSHLRIYKLVNLFLVHRTTILIKLL